MVFLKEHLKGNHYDWSKQINHEDLMETPDRRAFDAANGNQVVYLINFFGSSVGKLTMEDGQRLEKLIREALPSDLKSELAVFNWLKGKYLYYWNTQVEEMP